MQRARAQQARRNLRVCENVSLGEKRFVAIVQVDEERFLIGGSSSSVSLLTRLQETKPFAAALDQEAAKIS
jgi:flagellar biogenesis protein FliO